MSKYTVQIVLNFNSGSTKVFSVEAASLTTCGQSVTFKGTDDSVVAYFNNVLFVEKAVNS